MKIVIIKLIQRRPRFKTIISSPEVRITIVMQSEGTHSYTDIVAKFLNLRMKVVGQN